MVKKIFPILVFVCLFCAVCVFSDEIEIDSEVIGLVSECEFFIIRAGEADGIEMGDGLIVHREGEKIAEAYIIEVRQNISAAEILAIEYGQEIEEGDSILIVKVVEEVTEEMPLVSEKKAKISGPKLAPALRSGSAYTAKPPIIETGDIISIMIDRDSKSVFAYTATVLRENGYSIISSNRATGILLADKPIALSLMWELWADAVAAISHKVVASFDIKSEGDSSRLTVSAFKEHFQKNKHIKRVVTKNSKYYNELVAVISRIKERSEY